MSIKNNDEQKKEKLELLRLRIFAGGIIVLFLVMFFLMNRAPESPENRVFKYKYYSAS